MVPAQRLNLLATLLADDRATVSDIRNVDVRFCQNANNGTRAALIAHDSASILLHESVFSVVTALSDGNLHAVRKVLRRSDKVMKVVPQELGASLTSVSVENREKLYLLFR